MPVSIYTVVLPHQDVRKIQKPYSDNIKKLRQ